ncbi:flavodoxin-dependent (E)-4-hydroxy-3-methylbut-2-enyl-diphosphate synthase [Candidatus Fermentibacterales bacterium]|nr:flavodoxin-dependent (E)-4-hydroxy-3-methylbut-2-enyl-diphosphate synthase [Candidatus Fermentibacterales bacterium]
MPRTSRKVLVGGIPLGGGSPVVVQTMTNTPTSSAASTLEQVRGLALAGAELVRVAVPDEKSAEALHEIVQGSTVPIVADIQFDAELAMRALRAGVAKLRLNPGNVRRRKQIEAIAAEAASRKVPIRVGVNSGSLPGDLLERFGGPSPECMWMAAERQIGILRDSGFEMIVVSLKASSPRLTIDSNRLAARECDYPLHLGVTESGPPLTGSVRSASALSVLLEEGIGDTIRISLSGDPAIELTAAWAMLSALGIRRRGPVIVSCPTCARARMDVASLAGEVEALLSGRTGLFSVAIMGCEVNGPGEAGEADLALIGSPSGILLYRSGKVIERFDCPAEDGVANAAQRLHLTEQLRSALISEIEELAAREEVRVVREEHDPGSS